MDVDWLAVYGAGLSTAIGVAGLIRWFLLRPKERVNKVKVILQTVYAPIQTADEYFGSVALARLVSNLIRNRDRIIGLEATLQKVVPKIATRLMELIELVDNSPPGAEGVFLEETDETKPLVATLRKDIQKWLADHV